MRRIEKAFAGLRERRRRGIIPFVTAGDPSVPVSRSIVLKLADLGADIIELGVPFSDPMADGPTIQRSSARALAQGTSLDAVLGLVADLRRETDVPLVLFSYFNPVHRMGVEQFISRAAAAGVDGLLLTDAIGHEAAAVQKRLDAAGIDLISLVAATTSDTRLDEICGRATGFIYAVARAGVTGTQQPGPQAAAADLVARVRERTDLPVAVGFGISSRAHIKEVWNYADAAVVGSVIVSEIERSDEPVADVEKLVRSLLSTFANNRRGL